MKSGPKIILYFDGVCNLCNSVVDFFIRKDKKDRFLFCSLQSEEAARRLPEEFRQASGLKSVVVEENGVYFEKSRAVLKALIALGGIYRLFALLLILPTSVSDPFYDFIAKNRYKWFGMKNSCRVPSPSEKAKFI